MTPAKAKTAYETRDVAPRAVVYSGICLLLGTSLCGLLVTCLLVILPKPERPAKPVLETVSQEPPAPRLEIDGRADGAAVEAAAQSKLKGYAWVDESSGIARIPIARAMELMVQQGWGKP